MRRHTPNGIAEYDNVSMNIRVRKIDIVLAAIDCRSRPQRPDSVAGVRGLELRNVALQNAGPNSLVFQNILVPETFRENCNVSASPRPFAARRIRGEARVTVLRRRIDPLSDALGIRRLPAVETLGSVSRMRDRRRQQPGERHGHEAEKDKHSAVWPGARELHLSRRARSLLMGRERMRSENPGRHRLHVRPR